MKLSKFFMFSAAALAFAACSNDEDANLTMDGTKAITLSIEQPQTKAIQDPSDEGASQAITINKVTVKFIGTGNPGMTKTIKGDELKENKYTFYDIPKECTGIAVVVNNEANFFTTATAETAKTAANTTCYGLSNTMTHAGEIEEGGKAYQKYTVSVEAKPVTARIEAQGLKLVQKGNGDEYATDETSKFETLNFTGVFLNGYMENGTFAQEGAEGITVTTVKNAVDDPKNENIWNNAKTNLLHDAIESESVWKKTFPQDITGGSGNGKVWAYNFFTDNDHKLPKLTFVFDNAKLKKTEGNLAQTTRFAVVTKYKNSAGDIQQLEAGNIYRITDLRVVDENISGNVEGEDAIAVEATVTVTPWTIQDTTVEWN